ncbi:MAG: carbonic anhydrase [Gammaproteobacteria bacterium]|jgi:carbonic anhydrase|nr:carbonic anhydrase [Gammaproteobacteria bacterium]
MISATDALERLRDGNRRFISNEVSEKVLTIREHRAGAAAPQNPFAIILACSDSRVPTELIFDQGIGDLFVIRVAGNIVAPSQIGSIEYAAKQFGTRLVVVLGHSNCGAIIATLRELALKESHRSPNLRAIVDRIRPALDPVLEEYYDVEDEVVVASCVRANVQASVDGLQHGSLILEQLIEAKELNIIGAEYSIETGYIDFFESD